MKERGEVIKQKIPELIMSDEQKFYEDYNRSYKNTLLLHNYKI